MSEGRWVDIRSLKAWASKHLPRGSNLREVIMLDEDRLTPEAFLAKMEVWLALYDMERGDAEQCSTKRKERVKWGRGAGCSPAGLRLKEGVLVEAAEPAGGGSA